MGVGKASQALRLLLDGAVLSLRPIGEPRDCGGIYVPRSRLITKAREYVRIPLRKGISGSPDALNLRV